MPVSRKQDSKGPYYQWGSKGAKYHYSSGNEAARKRAKHKAIIQGEAIKSKGYK